MSLSSIQEPAALVISCFDQLGPSGKIRLILASQSPRRREILDMMGLAGRFDVMPSPLDETLVQQRLRQQSETASVDPIEYTRTLAEEKAKALAETLDSIERTTLVLGSDTIVDLEGVILEKPVDERDAKNTLSRLSGRQHYVHTGVALYAVTKSKYGAGIECSKVVSFVDAATVTFAELTPADINAYVATGEPMDKAGSYGIQGIGGQLVERVEGDFFTVMGLPMHRVSRELSKAMQDLL
mmetsp:Transcript_18690/g.24077  ORF Transcript_18690/g.24077 Transcript_18690/m.24077 type:complete len:241 (+) Transcript_18690:182-904(+)